jgi:DNA-binding beta-propeller fold protein YncE
VEEDKASGNREEKQMRIPAMLAVAAAFLIASGQARSEDPNSAPNPYRVVDNWAQLPEGRAWGQAIGIDIDRDGRSVWVYERCGAKVCTGSKLDPIHKLDPSGKVVASFGGGLINWPHGFFVDRDGNVWVTDGRGAEGKGHTVIKFSPEGKVLMTLGKPGVAGDGPDTFNAPSDVLVAPNGTIFVADGHGDKTNARIVKLASDGKFIKAWGQQGSGPGDFDVPHGLAMDSLGRLFVADRSNDRIQIFDQDGKFLADWRQFGRPSGLYIDKNDILYAADSQSGEKYNAPFRQGIRIGSVKDGKVTAFITEEGPKPNMPEGVAADDDGNVFGGFTDRQAVKKFAKN